jgi:hypothetical protein
MAEGLGVWTNRITSGCAVIRSGQQTTRRGLLDHQATAFTFIQCGPRQKSIQILHEIRVQSLWAWQVRPNSRVVGNAKVLSITKNFLALPLVCQ